MDEQPRIIISRPIYPVRILRRNRRQHNRGIRGTPVVCDYIHRHAWLKEFQETLPAGYHATAYTGSCATGLSKKIPGIDITHDVEKEPGKYILVNSQNPRKIEFEGVGPCTLNGWEEKVAIHYPGIRRMATRFTLPGMYNYKKTVANFIDNMINNR